MKFNWGNGIAIFYSLFVVTMVYMVVRASQDDVNMVQDNYYDQDLNYEAFRKSRQEGMQVGVLAIEYLPAEKNVKIQFPQATDNIGGMIKFYRPSDRKMDQSVKIILDAQNSMVVAVDQLSGGYWKILVNWDVDGKSYYKEEPLVL
ncbi:MAG: FixH family protein [Saprospiraceae bacterium]|nr:FixH family protein [Saprospiraceae bacterium]